MSEHGALQQQFAALRTALNQQIIGQDYLTQRLLIALLAGGHLLVEGPPGLAKTRAIKSLSSLIEGDFHRLQFTPDLLPGDLTGTDIYNPAESQFVFQQGPLFHNLILADEINRAPAKVQSALLEAMEEKQITVGLQTYALPSPFMVMATQNPLEQEGTYPLPEAQLDRFIMHCLIDYPEAADEKTILQLTRAEAASLQTTEPETLISQTALLAAQQAVLSIHMSPSVEQYLVELVLASRNPAAYDQQLQHWVSFGASPRGTIALDRCARAHAWLNQRDYVSPEDVQAICKDVLRHRVILSYEAEAEGISADDFLDRLLIHVPVV